jgi:hypothetical protein
MEKKEARKILGVTKETSRNDIERKYSILLKKQRAKERPVDVEEQEDGDDSGNAVRPDAAPVVPPAEAREEYSFDQVTQAYNILMGYEVAIKEAPPSKAAPLLKKAGIDEKKARNFFYYYKWYFVIGILAVLAIVLSVRSCVNQEKPDFNIAFLGELSYSDAIDKLDAAIKAGVPEIKEPGFDGAFLSNNDQGEQAYAMNMKATVLLAAADIDVFILDKEAYQRYAKQGAFMSLDGYTAELGVDMEKNKENILGLTETDLETGEEKPVSDEKHLYGIDITGSKELKDAGVIGKEFIAAVRVTGENTDKAIKLIRFLMK